MWALHAGCAPRLKGPRDSEGSCGWKWKCGGLRRNLKRCGGLAFFIVALSCVREACDDSIAAS